ncbi:alkaline serine protease [Halobacillus fulvus]|nr:alkaline serine protease [Halobacillus fulvus]
MTFVKKYLGFVMMLCLVSLIVYPIGSSAENESEKRFVIGFEDQIQKDILENIPHEEVHTYPSIQALTVEMNEKQAAALENHPAIKWIEEDQQVEVTRQVRNWGYDVLGARTSKQLGLTGDGIKIAVIDTGVNTSHPDLKIAGGVTFVEDTTTYEDENGHGTHVTGVINAQNNNIGTIGVAPEAEIYAVKALDRGGIGNESDVMAGVQWAIDHDIDIINLSLTAPYASENLKEIINKAHQNGIHIVAASGNDRDGSGQITNDVMYPGRYENTLSVGAVTEDLKRASFSYQGKSLDAVAPGEQIYSTYIQQNESSYGYLSGTSMASPYVAGSIALYKQLYPDYTKAEIENLLIDHAIDLGPKGKDEAYGYGLVKSPASYFIDVEHRSWFKNYVNALAQEDWIQGYRDDKYRPYRDVTRQEVVTLVGRILDLDGTKRATSYSDVSSDLFGSGYIASATEEGIVEGLPGNQFRPNAPIDRGDVALIIERAFGPFTDGSPQFSDVENGKYYEDAINALAEEQILNGYNGTEFRPEQSINRAEIATILAKVLDPSLRE